MGILRIISLSVTFQLRLSKLHYDYVRLWVFFFKTPKNDKLEVLRIDFRTHCVRRGSIYDILGLNSNSFVAIWILGTSKVCGASVPQTQVVYSNRYHYEDSGRHVACPHHPSYH